MIGGESKNTKSYRLLASAMNSFMAAELRIPMELLGRRPEGIKSRDGTGVV